MKNLTLLLMATSLQQFGKLTACSFFLMVVCSTAAAQTSINQNQNNVIVNSTPVVIEKPVYIERYRTIYVGKPQPKRVAKKLPAPIKLLGYLWVFPEDLGNFKRQPLGVVESINAQNMYGRDNWRIPTPDELAVLEGNANKVGLGDDIYLATDHSNGVLRLVSTDETKQQKAIRLNGGVLINGTVWANRNVGANDIQSAGRQFTYKEALNACPNGWRLPTKDELEELINNGCSTIRGGGSVCGNTPNQIYLPTTDSNYEYDMAGRRLEKCRNGRYWSSTSSSEYIAFSLGLGGTCNSDYSSINTESKTMEYCVRCVLDE